MHVLKCSVTCLEKHVRHVYVRHFVLGFVSSRPEVDPLLGEKAGCQRTISHTCAYHPAGALTQVQCHLPLQQLYSHFRISLMEFVIL